MPNIAKLLCPIFRKEKRQHNHNNGSTTSISGFSMTAEGTRNDVPIEYRNFPTSTNRALSFEVRVLSEVKRAIKVLQSANVADIRSIRLGGIELALGYLGVSGLFLMPELFSTIEQFTGLQKLEIDNVNVAIPRLDLARLLQKGRGTLVELKLRNLFYILENDSPMGEINASLRNHPSLRKVSLGRPEMEDFLKSISTCPQLQSLNLNVEGRSIRYSYLEIVPLICQNLQGHKTLKELTIQSIFRPTDIDAIRTFLQTNTVLEKLSLSCVSILPPLAPLADALRINRSLRKLHFVVGLGYSLSQDNADAFVELMRENMVLEEIEFRHPNPRQNADFSTAFNHPAPPNTVFAVPGNFERFVALYCRLNQGGRRHHLLHSGVATPEDWIDAIIAHRGNTPIVFFLLSENPGLCVLHNR